MSVSISPVERPKEKAAREALETKLSPGELLLGYTLGRSTMGGFFDKEFHVGLTNRRFIIFKSKQPDQVRSIYPPVLTKVSFSKGIGFYSPRGLRLEFHGESLTFYTPRNFWLQSLNPPWQEHGKQIVDCYNQGLMANYFNSSAQALQQVNDLLGMGLLGASKDLLQDTMAADPSVKTDPRSIDLLRYFSDQTLALQAGAGMFFVVLLYFFLLAGLGAASLSPVGMIIALVACYNLLRVRLSWRGAALVLGLLNAIINIIGGISAQSPFDVMMWVAFGLAMTLVLTGKPGRVRTLIAAGIFLLGFVGVFAVILVAAIIGN